MRAAGSGASRARHLAMGRALPRPQAQSACDFVAACVLWTLHAVLVVLRLALGVLFSARRLISWAFRLAVPRRSSALGLRKRPASIGFSIESGAATVDCAAQLCRRCVACGVRDIVLYDMRGQLEAAAQRLATSCSKGLKGPVVVHRGGETLAARAGQLQGGSGSGCDGSGRRICPGVGVHISLYSARSSRARVGSELREYCASVAKAQGDAKQPEIGRFAIGSNGGDTKESRSGGLGQPELIVVVGEHLSLKGFPPWLTGGAEIGHIRSRSDIEAGVDSALLVYSESQQRCGA